MTRRAVLLPGRLRFPGAAGWLIAAITLMLMLAVAAALMLRAMGAELAAASVGRFHVQIVAADPDRRDLDTLRAIERLRASGAVREVRPLSRAEMLALLRPWLGAAVDRDLPLPALIEARTAGAPDRAAIAELLAPVRTVRIDWGEAVAPLDRLIRMLGDVAAAIALASAAAAALVTALATRAALAAHGAAVVTLHDLGATDAQVASLVARRILVEAAAGAAAGGLAGWALLTWIGRRLAALEGGFAGGVAIDAGGTMLLAALPLALVALGVLVAALTTRLDLRRTP